MSVYDIDDIRSGAYYNDRLVSSNTVNEWEKSFENGTVIREDIEALFTQVKLLNERMWYVNSYIDHVATEINRNLSNADEGELGMSEDELYEFADVLRALEL